MSFLVIPHLCFLIRVKLLGLVHINAKAHLCHLGHRSLALQLRLPPLVDERIALGALARVDTIALLGLLLCKVSNMCLLLPH